MMLYKGGCHCGTIRLSYESGIPPGEAEVRACQCDFCRRHGARAVSDPMGRIGIAFHEREDAQHYRFGSQTADYLVCRNCGVYVAAVMDEGDRAFGVNALDDAGLFTKAAFPIDFSGESRAERIERRRQRWTPAILS